MAVIERRKKEEGRSPNDGVDADHFGYAQDKLRRWAQCAASLRVRRRQRTVNSEQRTVNSQQSTVSE